MASASFCMSSDQRPSFTASSINSTLAPASREASEIFGHSGLVVSTVSPGSTSSWTTSWIALMPEAVTTIRSLPIGRPLSRVW
jgi:hypothetical protein